MRLLAAIALLAALVPCASATPAQDALRAQIAVLRGQVPQLAVATDAPDLPKQVSALSDDLDALAQENPSRADAIGPVAAQASALQAVLGASGTPHTDKDFYKNVAPSVQALADAASALLPDAPTNAPPAPTVETDGLTGQAAAAARIQGLLAGAGNLGGGPGSVSTALPADAPLPRPRALSRQASPRYNSEVAAEQKALNAARRSEGLRPIADDGKFGPQTQSAVRDFQKRAGLPRTGVIDRATETALLSKFQSLDGLPVTGAQDSATQQALATGPGKVSERRPGSRGKAPDFDTTSARETIRGVKATVYTPYLARTKKEKRMEGSTLDAHGQKVCTLERYLSGSCPYVTVAIDPRLRVPNKTPLEIPAIDRLAGRQVLFRITDVGSKRLFHGTSHIDIATDSDQRSGYGAKISGREFTIFLPKGLHPARP